MQLPRVIWAMAFVASTLGGFQASSAALIMHWIDPVELPADILGVGVAIQANSADSPAGRINGNSQARGYAALEGGLPTGREWLPMDAASAANGRVPRGFFVRAGSPRGNAPRQSDGIVDELTTPEKALIGQAIAAVTSPRFVDEAAPHVDLASLSGTGSSNAIDREELAVSMSSGGNPPSADGGVHAGPLAATTLINPEPPSFVLWAVAGSVLLMGWRLRRHTTEHAALSAAV